MPWTLKLSERSDRARFRAAVAVMARGLEGPTREDGMIIALRERLDVPPRDTEGLLRFQQETMAAIAELVQEGELKVLRPERPGCPGSRVLMCP